MSNWETKRLATASIDRPEQVHEGDVYGDERHAETNSGGERQYPVKYEVVFADDNRVLLRNVDRSDDYRHERIPQFLEGLGSRWTPLSRGEGNLESVPDFNAALRLLELQRQQHEDNDTRKATHIAEGIDIAISLLRDMQPTRMEWTSIDGVGPETATNIEAAGIETDIDALVASDDTLLDIAGVGQTTVENIRRQVDSPL